MNIEKFISKYPQTSKHSSFSDEEINSIKGKIPDIGIDFLREYGRSSFDNGFFSVVGPNDIDNGLIFKEWGFFDDNYFMLLRTCFGGCVFSNSKDFFILNPHQAEFQNLGANFEAILNIMLRMDVYSNKTFYHDVFNKRKSDLHDLTGDKIYMFVPSIPLGGNFETSKLEVGSLVEHLSFLAQLNDNKAEKI